MPIGRIERLVDGGGVDIGIRLHGVSGRNRDGVVQVLYADVPGGPWNTQRRTAFIVLMQLAMDVPVPRGRADMFDDPDGLTDPGRPDVFHDGTDVIYRTIRISDPIWHGDHITFTLSRV